MLRPAAWVLPAVGSSPQCEEPLESPRVVHRSESLPDPLPQGGEGEQFARQRARNLFVPARVHVPLAILVSVLGATFTHAELKVTIELPDGWSYDRQCGPFVPAEPTCRVEGKLVPCVKGFCPERVGVIWLTSPAVLVSRDEEKAELLESDAGTWVSSQVLPDGWVLTWGGAQWPETYPFKVSRKIGSRVIECGGEATTLAGQQVMVNACKTLRAENTK
jgi:hypothetical protein